jgi:hypothetical protein
MHNISEEYGQKEEEKKDADKSSQNSPVDETEQKLLSGIPIDPSTVKIEDIKRYEGLMKGKAVSAISNASSLRG